MHRARCLDCARMERSCSHCCSGRQVGIHLEGHLSRHGRGHSARRFPRRAQLSLRSSRSCQRNFSSAYFACGMQLIGGQPWSSVETSASFRAYHSDVWHTPLVYKLHLSTMRRCKCPNLRWKLELLRSYKPIASQLRDILPKQRAPSSEVRLSHHRGAETPQTTFITMTRRATAQPENFVKDDAHRAFPVPDLPRWSLIHHAQREQAR